MFRALMNAQNRGASYNPNYTTAVVSTGATSQAYFTNSCQS